MTRDTDTQIVPLRRNPSRGVVPWVLAENAAIVGVAAAAHVLLEGAGVATGIRVSLSIGAAVLALVVVLVVIEPWGLRIRGRIAANVRLEPDRIAFEPRRGRTHEALRRDLVVRRLGYLYESGLKDHDPVLELRFPTRRRAIRILCSAAPAWPRMDGSVLNLPSYCVDTQGWAALLNYAEPPR